MKSLSLVIPAYGAGKMLSAILGHVPALKEAAERNGFELVEVVVVDDGNPRPVAGDDEVAGVPIRVLAAKGGWVRMSDVDESVALGSFATLALYADAAIVCGSRCGKDVRPFHRRVLSYVFRMLAGTGLKDSQCGFKLFNMALMRPIFETMRTERFAFDVELIRKAPSVVEVPVEWRGGRRSTLKVWRDAPRMLWDLVKIRCS